MHFALYNHFFLLFIFFCKKNKNESNKCNLGTRTLLLRLIKFIYSLLLLKIILIGFNLQFILFDFYNLFIMFFFCLLQESDGEKSDQDLVVDVANEVNISRIF